MATIRESRTFEGFEVTTMVTGTLWRQNCYLVRDEVTNATIVIDPGDEPSAIACALSESGGVVDSIVLTHGHHDHTGGVAELAAHFNVNAYISEEDLRLALRAPTYALAFHNRRIPRPHPLVTFPLGSTLRTGRFSLATVAAPGHTPGSIVIHAPGLVLTGDTLLFESIGRTDLPGGDLEALMGSVEHLVQLPGPTVVLPGHGRAWTIAEARAWWRSGAARDVLRQRQQIVAEIPASSAP